MIKLKNLMKNRAYVIFGMTGAGKSFAVSAVCQKLNLRRIQNTTTRPQRGPEDTEYNFTTAEKFLEDQGRYVAVRAYETFIEAVPKTHYYGVDKLELDKGGILITDFEGYKELLQRDSDLVGIYIYADKTTRTARAALREGYKPEEFERRNKDDSQKFKIEEIVELGKKNNVYLLENNLDTDINDLVDKICEIIKMYK